VAKILTIEDDQIVGRDIVDTLTGAGFDVEWVMSGQDGIARAVHDEFDVITLDRVLPGIDGLTILKTLRGVGIETPVLMISALSDVDERVRGLLAGGDDYIPKPFSAEEMKARIEVLLRRRGRRLQAASTVLRVDDLEIDLIARTATRGCCRATARRIQTTRILCPKLRTDPDPHDDLPVRLGHAFRSGHQSDRGVRRFTAQEDRSPRHAAVAQDRARIGLHARVSHDNELVAQHDISSADDLCAGVRRLGRRARVDQLLELRELHGQASRLQHQLAVPVFRSIAS
jgi:DNA-binding response OmpR family regulator